MACYLNGCEIICLDDRVYRVQSGVQSGPVGGLVWSGLYRTGSYKNDIGTGSEKIILGLDISGHYRMTPSHCAWGIPDCCAVRLI